MSQFEVIEFLNNNNTNKYTTKELCLEFNVTRSSMGRVLAVCFKRGFINKEDIGNPFPIEYNYFVKVGK